MVPTDRTVVYDDIYTSAISKLACYHSDNLTPRPERYGVPLNERSGGSERMWPRDCRCVEKHTFFTSKRFLPLSFFPFSLLVSTGGSTSISAMMDVTGELVYWTGRQTVSGFAYLIDSIQTMSALASAFLSSFASQKNGKVGSASRSYST